MVKREFREVNISWLKENPDNPRVISDTAVKKVARSIAEYGFNAPVVCDENGMLLAGHTRVRAVKILGEKAPERIPAYIVSGMTDDEKKFYTIADNRTGEFAEWDFAKLIEQLDNEEHFTGFFADNILGEVDVDIFADDEDRDAKAHVGKIVVHELDENARKAVINVLDNFGVPYETI